MICWNEVWAVNLIKYGTDVIQFPLEKRQTENG